MLTELGEYLSVPQLLPPFAVGPADPIHRACTAFVCTCTKIGLIHQWFFFSQGCGADAPLAWCHFTWVDAPLADAIRGTDLQRIAPDVRSTGTSRIYPTLTEYGVV